MNNKGTPMKLIIAIRQ